MPCDDDDFEFYIDIVGDPGPAGSGGGGSGTSGYSGYSGFSGTSGYSGASGYSGINGSNGSQGISGFSGYSGTNGVIGSDGASGFSGFSGFSGASNLTSKQLLTAVLSPSTFTAAIGVSSYDITSLMVGKVAANSVGITEGVLIDFPNNVVILRDLNTTYPLADELGNEFYARIFESAGTWSLLTYVYSAGTQVLKGLQSTGQVQFAYVERFNLEDLPQDATQPIFPPVTRSAYDIFQDIQIDAAHQWDKDGDSVKPRAGNDAVEYEAHASAPSTPAANMIKTYVIATGISPNKLVKVCQMGEDGIETVISSMIV